MPVVCAARGYDGLAATRGVCRRLLACVVPVCLLLRGNANLVYVRSPPAGRHACRSTILRTTTCGSASVSPSRPPYCMLLCWGVGPGLAASPMPMRVSCPNAALRKTRRAWTTYSIGEQPSSTQSRHCRLLLYYHQLKWIYDDLFWIIHMSIVLYQIEISNCSL